MREPGVLAFRVTVPRPYEDQLLCLLWECGTQGVEHAADDCAASVLIAYFPSEAGADRGLLDTLRSVPGTEAEPVDVEAILSAARHAQFNQVSISLLAGDAGRPLQRGRFGTVVPDLPALRHAYGPVGPLEGSQDGEWVALVIGPARA